MKQQPPVCSQPAGCVGPGVSSKGSWVLGSSDAGVEERLEGFVAPSLENKWTALVAADTKPGRASGLQPHRGLQGERANPSAR